MKKKRKLTMPINIHSASITKTNLPPVARRDASIYRAPAARHDRIRYYKHKCGKDISARIVMFQGNEHGV